MNDYAFRAFWKDGEVYVRTFRKVRETPKGGWYLAELEQPLNPSGRYFLAHNDNNDGKASPSAGWSYISNFVCQEPSRAASKEIWWGGGNRLASSVQLALKSLRIRTRNHYGYAKRKLQQVEKRCELLGIQPDPTILQKDTRWSY